MNDFKFWLQVAIGLGQLFLAWIALRKVPSMAPTASLPTSIQQSIVKRYWPIVVIGVLMVGAWIPYFLNSETRHVYLTAWGPVTATVDTRSLIEDKDRSRLMLVSLIPDISIDPMNDVTIARSRTYEIKAPIMDMVVIQNTSWSARARVGRLANIYLLEVPKEFAIERLTTLADVQHLGGKILDTAAGPITTQ